MYIFYFCVCVFYLLLLGNTLDMLQKVTRKTEQLFFSTSIKDIVRTSTVEQQKEWFYAVMVNIGSNPFQHPH